jgi:hypothetical protein
MGGAVAGLPAEVSLQWHMVSKQVCWILASHTAEIRKSTFWEITSRNLLNNWNFSIFRVEE